MKELPSRLEKLRGAETQRAFARRLGVPLNTYTNWVRGINTPRAEQLQNICTECNVSMESLIGVLPLPETPNPVVNESSTCYDQALEIADLRSEVEALKIDVKLLKKLILK